MATQIAFGLTVANTRITSPDEILDFLESENQHVSSFRRAPDFRAGPQASVNDYLLVLNTAGSVASVASILWLAYEKFVQQRKTADDADNAGVIIFVRPMKRAPVNFWLGGREISKEEFFRDFTTKIEALTNAGDVDEYNDVIDNMIADSKRWIPRDEYRGGNSNDDIVAMMQEFEDLQGDRG